MSSSSSSATPPSGPAGNAAVLALHWQTNVVAPEGFFGAMLAEPVAASGVIGRAATFHRAARDAGATIVWTRFTVPEDEGELVRNTAFMEAVAEHQDAFRPDGQGAALIPEMTPDEADWVQDNQRLSGLAGSDLAERLRAAGVDTLYITGVATNLTVEQTARHGTDMGFTVHVVSDCVTAATGEIHEASLGNLELATAGNLSADRALALLAG